MPTVITKEEAAAVLRANLNADGGVHSFALAAGGLMLLGADGSLENALEKVKGATEVGWVEGPAGHDLAVAYADGLYYYQVARP